MNKGYFSGRMVEDPTLKFVGQSERAVVNTSIAVDRKGRNSKKKGSKYEKECDFWSITFWGATAEAVAKYVRKGDQLFVSGDIILEKWEDKESGKIRSKPIIECGTFDFGQKAKGNREQPEAGNEDLFGNKEEVPF